MPPVALAGFLRLYVAPAAEPLADTVLDVSNPHVARSVLAVDGVKLGEVAPLARITVSGLSPGVHTLGWTTPSGFERTATATATAPTPGR